MYLLRQQIEFCLASLKKECLLSVMKVGTGPIDHQFNYHTKQHIFLALPKCAMDEYLEFYSIIQYNIYAVGLCSTKTAVWVCSRTAIYFAN